MRPDAPLARAAPARNVAARLKRRAMSDIAGQEDHRRHRRAVPALVTERGLVQATIVEFSLG